MRRTTREHAEDPGKGPHPGSMPNGGSLSATSAKRRAKKGKAKMRTSEEGEAVRRPSQPRDSPDRRKRSLSSLQTPNAVVTGVRPVGPGEEVANKHSRKRSRTKDLGSALQAVATKGKEKVDLEINGTNHQIRLRITSPVKKKKVPSRGDTKSKGAESAVVKQRLTRLGNVETKDGGIQTTSTTAAAAEVSTNDNVVLPPPNAQVLISELPLQQRPIPTVNHQVATAREVHRGGTVHVAQEQPQSGQCAGTAYHPQGAIVLALQTGIVSRDVLTPVVGSSSAVPPTCAEVAKAIQVPDHSSVPLQNTRPSPFVAEFSQVAEIADQITAPPSIKTPVDPPPLDFAGFPDLVDTGADDVSISLGFSPPKSPVSSHPNLRTPACLDRPCTVSRDSQPRADRNDGSEGVLEGHILATAIREVSEPASPITPAAPVLAEVPSPSSPRSPVCSIRPVPFRKSPVRQPPPASRPPKSPKTKETLVYLHEEPLKIPPSIAGRIHPVGGETIQTHLMESTAKMLLKTMPADQRAAFVEANEKLCENFVVPTGEGSTQRKRKTDRACEKSSCRKKKKVAKDDKAKDAGKAVAVQETVDVTALAVQTPEKGIALSVQDDEADVAALAYVDKMISEWQGRRAKLTMMKGSPSPRESSKGQQTRTSTENPVHVKRVSGGKASGRKASGRDLSSDSSNPVPCPSASGSVLMSDPLSLGTWDVNRDVPPSQVNGMAHPIGQFWRHMKNFAFERAAFTFPWQIDWPQQDNLSKVRFKFRLKKLYPGDWDDAWVMQMIGNNIRERRVRLRGSFARAVNKNSVPIAGGVSKESWNAIYDSLSNCQYQAKSDKCKVAADERTRRKGFIHKLGPKGVQGGTSSGDHHRMRRLNTPNKISFRALWRLYVMVGLAFKVALKCRPLLKSIRQRQRRGRRKDDRPEVMMKKALRRMAQTRTVRMRTKETPGATATRMVTRRAERTKAAVQMRVWTSGSDEGSD